MAGEYLSFFDFSGLTLDRALRSVGPGQGRAHRGYRSDMGSCTSSIINLLCNLDESLDPSGEAVGKGHRVAAVQ